MAVLALVVTVLAWLFPDPIGLNDAQDAANEPRPPQQTITFPTGDPGSEPHIELAPGSGPPGSRVTVTGTGFPAGADVEITFHLTKIGETRSDASGAFEVEVRIPSDISTNNFPWSIIARSSVYFDEEQFQVT
jgi:hypothetical protein